ncbi:MAG TPA: hypothetical protein VFG83_13510 [Kofleriaceae bacterium]|nr:hypothetical protein [Kofleriaceae bacterium]
MTAKSALDGLWLLLASEAAEAGDDARMPIMARAGNDRTYLLGFKNAATARQFMRASDLAHAEPRMVVDKNRSELLRIAQEHGAAGVLVDYDPATEQYSAATELY